MRDRKTGEGGRKGKKEREKERKEKRKWCAWVGWTWKEWQGLNKNLSPFWGPQWNFTAPLHLVSWWWGSPVALPPKIIESSGFVHVWARWEHPHAFPGKGNFDTALAGLCCSMGSALVQDLGTSLNLSPLTLRCKGLCQSHSWLPQSCGLHPQGAKLDPSVMYSSAPSPELSHFILSTCSPGIHSGCWWFSLQLFYSFAITGGSPSWRCWSHKF